MKNFIKEYQNPNESNLNFGLMDRDYDDDLIEHIVASCKSLEVLKYVKFLGYDYVQDERKIDINDYIMTRKKQKKGEVSKYMFLKDSRYAELKLKFKLNCRDKTETLTKKLLIPVPDRDGYYTIKGNKYFLMYQLVDASTYTTSQNLTLKSLMPVSVKRNSKEYKDSTGELHVAPTYSIYVFRKEIDILLFYFAKTGVKKALEYFSVDKVIRFVDSERDPENNMYFTISSKIMLEVNKHFFLKHQYVRSMTFMILNIVTNRLTFDMLEDKDYWVERIGSLNATNVYNYREKGLNTLTFFDRMLDETTKKILKLHGHNKKNIYSVVRWMIQNFNELRKKDNLDLTNKRLRCNEYIASLLTKAFSDRVNRTIRLGNKVTIENVRHIFKFQGDIIIQQLHTSGLLRFDDKINDMDFFSKLKYTMKGPNALGGKNANNISVKYRGIDPSYIGKIDINVCGTSDPGSTGIITPFAKTHGLYFDKNHEPEGSIFNFEREVATHEKNAETDGMYIDVYENCDNVNDMFAMQEKMSELINRSQVTKTLHERDDQYYVHINLGTDEDDEI